MSAPTLFISYRRDDSQAWAGRIADYLNEQTNTNVLIDVDSISRGQDYTQAIADSVQVADVILVVIGQSWLNATDADGALRLQDQDDPVRLEVLWSLQQDKLIVPVLVDGAPMPSRKNLPEELGDLAVRNGLTLNHQTFRRDLEQLIRDFGHLGAAVVDSSVVTSSAAAAPAAPPPAAPAPVAAGAVVGPAAVHAPPVPSVPPVGFAPPHPPR